MKGLELPINIVVVIAVAVLVMVVISVYFSGQTATQTQTISDSSALIKGCTMWRVSNCDVPSTDIVIYNYNPTGSFDGTGDPPWDNLYTACRRNSRFTEEDCKKVCSCPGAE
jgi:hypothetical protein